MSDFDIVFHEIHKLVVDDGTLKDVVELSPDELAEIETIRAFSADLLEPESVTYAASRAESADFTVHFHHHVE